MGFKRKGWNWEKQTGIWAFFKWQTGSSGSARAFSCLILQRSWRCKNLHSKCRGCWTLLFPVEMPGKAERAAKSGPDTVMPLCIHTDGCAQSKQDSAQKENKHGHTHCYFRDNAGVSRLGGQVCLVCEKDQVLHCSELVCAKELEFLINECN